MSWKFEAAFMLIPYDILKKQADGSFVWIEATANLRTATRRIQELAGRSPGEYWVFDQKSLAVVARSASAEMAVYPSHFNRTPYANPFREF